MAEGFVVGIDYTTFKDDNLHLYAVVRCLEIISEASRRLPDELKARHPSIEWRDMAGAGDVFMVTRLGRLARSTRDLLNTLATISDRKAGFRSLGDTWADTTTSHGGLC
jgi:hypothetical protein